MRNPLCKYYFVRAFNFFIFKEESIFTHAKKWRDKETNWVVLETSRGLQEETSVSPSLGDFLLMDPRQTAAEALGSAWILKKRKIATGILASRAKEAARSSWRRGLRAASRGSDGFWQKPGLKGRWAKPAKQSGPCQVAHFPQCWAVSRWWTF